MFIHIGENIVIPEDSIIAIIDLEKIKASEDSKKFIKIADEEGFIKRISKDSAKTLILTEVDKKSIIYLSPISSTTICKRSEYIQNL